MLNRRALLGSALAVPAALAAPRAARAATELRFIPQSDLATLDPIWTTADVTRNHAFMVFDQLYGLDDKLMPQPQMVEGHGVSQDGKQWDLTLRPGLRFHDGEPVLARDAVASIRRWGARDGFGRDLMAATEELSAPSDRLIRFKLKKPFPLLPMALATPNSMCCIMPERLIARDDGKPVTEMVGSGPFRFLKDEQVAGSRVAYAKFAGYVPRPEGAISSTAGPKQVHYDRVVWTVVPDAATASSAMAQGQFDWWEKPTIDLVPLLRRNRQMAVEVKDQMGSIGCLRFNHLHPPFDNPAIRRIVVSAVNQQDCMAAYAGAEPSLIKTGIGLFAPASPYANDAGLAALGAKKDAGSLAAELKAAGYDGTPIVFLAAQDQANIAPVALVAGDMLKRIGFNVDYQSLDWGTVVQRRASKSPPAQGGWNVFFTYLGSLSNVLPAANIALGVGPSSWPGWWTSTRRDGLMQRWFDAPDLATGQAVCRELQAMFFEDPSYAPLGMYEQPTCWNRRITGIPEGNPVFWGVRPA
ncbi:ABC transporter substrate-binding protein [Pseudoroseomonas deserti]|uniref:ABC transporter substrate-binding protein n=1 Tax=Teichococcus deserti TaxID=1817963 RepID=A0A1V2GZ36_9PROT|nr:ABC transporter substrate-binding protein [Pseudoroseomonas deserti]ONG48475.1 ABC transporter substrate-binding protein [Pseudoroseomonas deserti]